MRSAGLRCSMWVLCMVLSACAPAAVGQEFLPGKFSGERAFRLVAYQMERGPRFPGSPGHEQVGDWIADELKAAGWVVKEERFTYRGAELRNIEGRRRDLDGPLVVLGAHYDTRPVAERDDFSPEAPVPGANDGGSGVAVLLELARLLQTRELSCRVRLAFFDAEDSGGVEGWEWIVGSRHYASNLQETPAAVVVVDMVGDADLQIFGERRSTPELTSEIWQMAAELGHGGFIAEAKHAVLDDHVSFLERGIPAVEIIDLDYPHWHTTQDTLDKISARSLEQVGDTLLAWLLACE